MKTNHHIVDIDKYSLLFLNVNGIFRMHFCLIKELSFFKVTIILHSFGINFNSNK